MLIVYLSLSLSLIEPGMRVHWKCLQGNYSPGPWYQNVISDLKTNTLPQTGKYSFGFKSIPLAEKYHPSIIIACVYHCIIIMFCFKRTN